MKVEVVSRTHVGLKRTINEDNVLVRPDLSLFVVADGMGGHDAGEVASGLIVRALDALAETGTEPLLAEIETTLHGVNRELRLRAGPHAQIIGSTVAGLVLDEGRGHCFWAGDSRAYLLRGSALRQLTRDHSLVQELVDAGMLEPEKMHDHPNGNMITRAVGAAEELRLETNSFEVATGDLLCLFSDGVTRVIPDDELAETLAAPSALPELADGLVWTVLRRGAPDNLSLVLVRLLGDH